jgi:hypothetical protein
MPVRISNLVGTVKVSGATPHNGDEIVHGAKLRVPPGASCELLWEETIAVIAWPAGQSAPSFQSTLSAAELQSRLQGSAKLMLRKVSAPAGTAVVAPPLLSAAGAAAIAQGETYEVVVVELLADLKWRTGATKPQLNLRFPPAGFVTLQNKKGITPAHYLLQTPSGAITIRAEV